jgi:pimeloyl-ACP methyl ester carboxylesterase
MEDEPRPGNWTPLPPGAPLLRTCFLTSLPLIALALMAASSGCSARPRTPQYEIPHPETVITQDTVWAACDWDSASRAIEAECARIKVPADYLPDRSETFTLFVKRGKVAKPLRAQVWLVHGGPGASATQDMEQLSAGIYRDLPDVQYFAVDHRGVGGSERLTCPQITHVRAVAQESSWKGCADYLRKSVGSRLSLFSTTHSARDLGALIAKFQLPGVPVYVFGGSYGTYLVQRYLTLFPHQVHGVILEGIASSRFPFAGYDAGMNEVGQKVFDACARDAICMRQFERHPWLLARQVVSILDEGHCKELRWSSAQARFRLGSMLLYAPLRDLTPAVVHRLGRCSSADVRALAHLAAQLDNLVRGGVGQSDVLGVHVIASELIPRASGPDASGHFATSHTMSTGVEATISRLRDEWPIYAVEASVETSSYAGPVLALQGSLDPATPPSRARDLVQVLPSAKILWAQFPNGAHQLTGFTPTKGGEDCARSLMLNFIARPSGKLDERCMAEQEPVRWNGSRVLNRFLFGGPDAWGKTMNPISRQFN